MAELVFMLDVDNTLLDNDRAKDDLARKVEELVGPEAAKRWWEFYELVRRETDVVDYPRTLTRFRSAYPDEPRFPHLADYVLGLPYESYVYPGALETLAHLRTLGTPLILSDGDAVYQAAKIARAGLATAAEDNVLIYLHKETHLLDVVRRYPADHHVLIDDKPRILAAAKGILGARLTTVHVAQGHYGQTEERSAYPTADVELAAIGDLRTVSADALAGSAIR